MLLSPRAAVAGLVLPRLRLLGSCTCLVAHALGLPQEAFLSRGQTRRCRCGSSLSILPLYVPRLGVGVGAALETRRGEGARLPLRDRRTDTPTSAQTVANSHRRSAVDRRMHGPGLQAASTEAPTEGLSLVWPGWCPPGSGRKKEERLIKF